MIIKSNNEKITNPKDIYKITKSILESESEIDQQKEHFWVFGLNTENRIVYIDLLSLGNLTETVFKQGEVFRHAVMMKDIYGIIGCHNHPSGDVEPSRMDIELTMRLKKAGDIIGIKVIDHIIIGDDNFYSFNFES